MRDIHVTVTFNAVPTVLYIESDQINTWQLVGKRNLHTLIKWFVFNGWSKQALYLWCKGYSSTV